MKEDTLRVILKIGAVFNFMAALMLVFPGFFKQMVELPPAGSLFYSLMLALAICIYGVIYWWLAVRPEIERTILLLAIVGKFGVFTIAITCWALDEISSTAVGPAVVDLLFGAAFLLWYVKPAACEDTKA